ncbi:hypothetical protein [Alteromonas macleodii]|uniref:hypothetical protein n=1 Tax=Alteromonas macleodii TaxID=28108 RepID=UPI000C7942A0|nr:hypothetical protein [Alteromonas macleodii]
MNIDFSKLEMPRPLFTFDFTYKLMHSFVRNTEELIQISIEGYRENGPEVEEIEICADDGIYQYVEHYQGLDSQDVFLEDIFTKYFPSVQRRSALLTLVATYEHELERFCDVYTIKHNTPVKLNDLKGQGLERVHLFVKKLIGLQESKIFPTIKKIIKLRNSCAHNDAKICEKDGQPIRAIAEMIEDEKINVSQDGKHVHIEDGFLIFVLSQFDAYTSEIKETIEAK